MSGKVMNFIGPAGQFVKRIKNMLLIFKRNRFEIDFRSAHRRNDNRTADK